MSLVLIVDDKEMMRDSVASTLRRAGFEAVVAESVEAAMGVIGTKRPDAIVTDLRMPGATGLDLLERVRAIDEELPVVVMTAFAAVESAVQAIKLGAFDYITKPFEGDELVIAVKRAISHAQLLRDNAVLRASAPEVKPMGLERIIGSSAAIRRVKEQIAAVASSHGTVLVCGESGTGKEVVARAIHDMSPRQVGPFLAVNCAALSESLLESELFGHERGAFTGADKLRKGRFELSQGGSLLLDEVSEVGPQIQAKLLRVIQERAFERVGSSTSIGTDARVIATSNRDLPRAVERGSFRRDLFFRLNVLPIHLPPLRDRAEDIAELAANFLDSVCRREGRASIRFDAGALELLVSYSWPGNVRELQNICERAAVLFATSRHGSTPAPVRREAIESWLLPIEQTSGTATRIETPMRGVPLPEPKPAADPTSFLIRPLEEMERDAVVLTLRRFNGHRVKTARALGIGVRTLGLKLKKWKEAKLVAETL
ncbi:MAG: sigma-54-dependent transcriptional regulator [Phycisphaerales bacterium]